MAQKTIVNNSPYTITVYLHTRIGDNPKNSGETVFYVIKQQSQQTFLYGNYQNPYLNGITVTWESNGNSYSQSRGVVKRSSSWDNILNTHKTLYISISDEILTVSS